MNMRTNQRENDEDRFFLATMGQKVNGKGPLATLIEMAFESGPKMRKKVAAHLLEFEGMKIHKAKRKIEVL